MRRSKSGGNGKGWQEGWTGGKGRMVCVLLSIMVVFFVANLFYFVVVPSFSSESPQEEEEKEEPVLFGRKRPHLYLLGEDKEGVAHILKEVTFFPGKDPKINYPLTAKQVHDVNELLDATSFFQEIQQKKLVIVQGKERVGFSEGESAPSTVFLQEKERRKDRERVFLNGIEEKERRERSWKGGEKVTEKAKEKDREREREKEREREWEKEEKCVIFYFVSFSNGFWENEWLEMTHCEIHLFSIEMGAIPPFLDLFWTEFPKNERFSIGQLSYVPSERRDTLIRQMASQNFNKDRDSKVNSILDFSASLSGGSFGVGNVAGGFVGVNSGSHNVREDIGEDGLIVNGQGMDLTERCRQNFYFKKDFILRPVQGKVKNEDKNYFTLSREFGASLLSYSRSGVGKYSSNRLQYHKRALWNTTGVSTEKRLTCIFSTLFSFMKEQQVKNLTVLRINYGKQTVPVLKSLLKASLRKNSCQFPAKELVLDICLDPVDLKKDQDDIINIIHTLIDDFGMSLVRSESIGKVNADCVLIQYFFVPSRSLLSPSALSLAPPAPTSCLKGKRLKAGGEGGGKAQLMKKKQKPNGVVFSLADTYTLDQLLVMIKTFFLNFNLRYRYPLVLFYEQEFETEKHIITDFLPLALRKLIIFKKITLSTPTYLTPDLVPNQTVCTPLRNLGYRHMCQFMSYEVHSHLAEWEWHFRLDSDSVIPSEIGYDIFEFMEEKQMLYGFRAVAEELPECTTNLYESVEEFMAKKKITPTFFHLWDRMAIFYNNFEISHRSVWLSPEYENYIDFIFRKGGIYQHRWGDAPIKSVYLSTHVPLTKIYAFDDVPYMHLPFSNHEALGLNNKAAQSMIKKWHVVSHKALFDNNSSEKITHYWGEEEEEDWQEEPWEEEEEDWEHFQQPPHPQHQQHQETREEKALQKPALLQRLAQLPSPPHPPPPPPPPTPPPHHPNSNQNIVKWGKKAKALERIEKQQQEELEEEIRVKREKEKMELEKAHSAKLRVFENDKTPNHNFRCQMAPQEFLKGMSLVSSTHEMDQKGILKGKIAPKKAKNGDRVSSVAIFFFSFGVLFLFLIFIVVVFFLKSEKNQHEWDGWDDDDE